MRRTGDDPTHFRLGDEKYIAFPEQKKLTPPNWFLNPSGGANFTRMIHKQSIQVHFLLVRVFAASKFITDLKPDDIGTAFIVTIDGAAK